jgi:hypothetical protein
MADDKELPNAILPSYDGSDSMTHLYIYFGQTQWAQLNRAVAEVRASPPAMAGLMA